MAKISPSNSDKESLVQQVYDKYLSQAFGQVGRQYRCDAHYEFNFKHLPNFKNAKDSVIRLLCEYKYDLDFSNQDTLGKVLAQLVSYLRKFQSSDIAPSTILVGDVNEVMVSHTNWLIKFTNFPEIDWNSPANSIGTKYPELTNAIKADPEFTNLQVLNFTDLTDFDFGKDIILNIFNLTAGTDRKIAINEGNIFRYSEFFMNKVIADENFKKNSVALNGALYQMLIGDASIPYRDADREKKIVKATFEAEKVNVYKDAFKYLIGHTVTEYSTQQLQNLTGIFDRLIDDNRRRMDGKFYTPAHLAERARQYADKYLGEDWRTRGVVWDCAAGTANLTKGVYFGKLFVSTLDREELGAAELSNSIDHRFTTAFQYDFLNDPYEKLPEELRNAIESGTELTFFVNPPYKRAGGGTGTGANADAVSRNKILREMKDDGFQVDDILCQFLYKMSKFPNINIVVFGKSTWITGHKYSKLRSFLETKLDYLGGFVCSSSEFHGNEGKWPVILSCFRSKSNETPNKYVYDVDDDKKYEFYNTDGTMLNDYAKLKPNKEDLISPYPYTSNGLEINTGHNSPHNYTYKNALGSISSKSNCRNGSSREVCLWSIPYSDLKFKGFMIYPENFIKCCEIFVARVLTKPTSYLNDREEYTIPDTTIEGYENYSSDAVLLSMFLPEAKATSVDLEYKGNSFHIPNHFFWLTKKEFMETVANNQLLEGEPDEVPYMTTVLNDPGVTQDGYDAVILATELLKDSYEYREVFGVSNPKLQLHQWDAGYKQLKPLWEYVAEQDEAFKTKYEKWKGMIIALKAKVRPLIWKYGFLKGEPD